MATPEIQPTKPSLEYRPEVEQGDSDMIIKLLEEHQKAIESGDETFIKKTMQELIDGLEEVGREHGLIPEDYNKLVNGLERNRPGGITMVRGAEMKRLLPSLIEDNDYEVGFRGVTKMPYPNAASGTVEGLQVAFEQGQGEHGIRSAIVFDAHDVARKEVANKPYYWQIDGIIQPKDIKHLLLRMPRKNFPEARLTLEEKKLFEKHPDLPFVFRAFEKMSVKVERLAA